ncbi:MAG: ribosome biogenesis GTPase Der [Deltaproteobacteria bacterium]|nr:ribosome biogenesis GTPase Der [Deltaproteobacteria bacterium]
MNAAGAKPVVAVVGRPNVGKSTLFNRLVGRRLALVHDEPGVKRDRHYADARSLGRDYLLVDTGGFDPEVQDEMGGGIRHQLDIALAEADVVVCVLDAREGPTGVDGAAVDLLRRSAKPVVYFANKSDTARHEQEASELYRLGVPQLVCGSALHGRNVAELERAIVARLPAAVPARGGAEAGDGAPAPAAGGPGPALRVAVIGRPNAGKSSLVNHILGEERLLVDSKPGTTRDAIDVRVVRRRRELVLVDTAGLRRKASVARGRSTLEALCVMGAIRALERAEIAVLVCDAAAGVAEQDAKILGLAVDRGRAAVVALNKIDLLGREARRAAERQAREVLSFAPWAPLCPLSATTGRGAGQLLDTVLRVGASYHQRVPTAELNRFFEQVLASHPPTTSGGRAPRLQYITQACIAPPLFVVMARGAGELHFSFQRYVVNSIRRSFGFEGVPVRVRYRPPRRRER